MIWKEGRCRLEDAREAAEILRSRFATVCEEAVIAGSIRREKEWVKDIELVLLPDTNVPWRIGASRIDTMIMQLLADGAVRWDTEVKRNGPRYKRFKLPGSGLCADVFLADATNFGNTLAIRTGPGEWNRLLFAYLPVRSLRQSDGNLWFEAENPAEDVLIPCRTEEEFFFHAAWPCLPPSERTLERARQILKKRGDCPNPWSPFNPMMTVSG